jgi:hypothetical protein
MKIKHLAIFLLFVSGFTYGQKKNKSGAKYTYETKCMGTEMDGSLTLEAWGKGRNYKDATEQAKKNAVRDVILRGIKAGDGGCNRDPLIISPKAESRYEDYFAVFFADGGEYLEFVSTKDERVRNKVKRNKKKTKQMQQRMVVVRVDRLALKKKLKEDAIN